MQDLSFPQGTVEHRTGPCPEARHVRHRAHEQVDRDPQGSQDPPQAHHLLGLVDRLAYDDEEIHVRVLRWLPAGIRSEENDLLRVSDLSQDPYRVLDLAIRDHSTSSAPAAEPLA